MKRLFLCLLVFFPLYYPPYKISNAQMTTAQAVLFDAKVLNDKYGNRPQWPHMPFFAGEHLTPEEARAALPYEIACESQGKDVKVVDDNGFYSYGILQYQSSTWNQFEVESGKKGSPMNDDDAITTGLWALQHGYIAKWSCSKLTGLLR